MHRGGDVGLRIVAHGKLQVPCACGTSPFCYAELDVLIGRKVYYKMIFFTSIKYNVLLGIRLD